MGSFSITKYILQSISVASQPLNDVVVEAIDFFFANKYEFAEQYRRFSATLSTATPT
jgi:hypothetical protein